VRLVVAVFDHVTQPEELKKRLDAYSVSDAYVDDFLYPRVETRRIREICVTERGRLVCRQSFDLYQGIRA
jgi:hypothetical protein